MRNWLWVCVQTSTQPKPDKAAALNCLGNCRSGSASRRSSLFTDLILRRSAPGILYNSSLTFQFLKKLCCFASPGDSRVASSSSSIATFPIRRLLYRHFVRRDAGLDLLDKWALSFVKLLEARCGASLFHKGMMCRKAELSGAVPALWVADAADASE